MTKKKMGPVSESDNACMRTVKFPKASCVCASCSKRLTTFSYNGKGKRTLLHFYCQKCKTETTVIPTGSTAKEVAAYTKETERRSTAIHQLWHKFCKQFKTKDGAWRHQDPYQLSLTVEALCGTKGWEGLHVVRCDDAVHAGSDLILVEHCDHKTGYYFGTTIVYVPQCTGEPPTEFFLYLSHLKQLLTVLQTIKKKSGRGPDDE